VGEQKRILFLGAGSDQVPAIKYAKEAGHYVITCDYLPNNQGHKYGDEYHDVNTIDKKAVLTLVKSLSVDAVLSYGTDANAPTQAYVLEELGMKTNPYSSVSLLTHKDKFRAFLKQHDFYVPKVKVFSSDEVLMKELKDFNFPVIVKPVDSSGSNGVSKVTSVESLNEAYEHASKFSRSKTIIIEEFFEREGPMYDAEGLLIDGELKFICLADNMRFDDINPFLPAGSLMPSSLSTKIESYVKGEFQRLFTLLKMENGPFNAEFSFNKEGTLFIVDIAPRNGGKIFPTGIGYATGANLFKYTVDCALNQNCNEISQYNTIQTPTAFLILFSRKSGVYKGVRYNDSLANNIIEESLYLQKGERIVKGTRGADRIGEVYFQFKSVEEMREKMGNIENLVELIVEEGIA